MFHTSLKRIKWKKLGLHVSELVIQVFVFTVNQKTSLKMVLQRTKSNNIIAKHVTKDL